VGVRPIVGRYGFAIVSMLAVVAIRFALTPVLEDRAQYVILALPIAVTAYLAGFWPGVVCTLTGVAAVLTLLVPPIGVLHPPTGADAAGSILFLISGLLIAAIGDLARRRGEALERRNAELERLLSENRALLTLRDGFSGMLSHEMRTPLTVILGGLRLMARSPVVRTDTDLAGMVADAEHEAERLDRLVEDLLVVSRGDADLQVEREPVLVQHVIHSVVSDVARRHPGLSLELDVEARMPPVSGDGVLVAQILTNAFSNCAKYAGERASVVVEARHIAGFVRVDVTDDGPGFPEASLDRAFQAFYRAPETAPTVRGAGVGLYVVRRLVEAMGGSVRVSNRSPTGACLSFELPVDTAGEQGTGADRL
jgi:K+-sensing histidine kinase KdpD